jgi:very-short-patch-repair endonuclease
MLRKGRTGFRFRRQHPVSGYFLDFYCPEAMVCVEVDGPTHQLDVGRDMRRDRRLAELGIATVRIPTSDLYDPIGINLPKWRRKIVELCDQRTAPPPTPSPDAATPRPGRGLPKAKV